MLMTGVANAFLSLRRCDDNKLLPLLLIAKWISIITCLENDSEPL